MQVQGRLTLLKRLATAFHSTLRWSCRFWKHFCLSCNVFCIDYTHSSLPSKKINSISPLSLCSHSCSFLLPFWLHAFLQLRWWTGNEKNVGLSLFSQGWIIMFDSTTISAQACNSSPLWCLIYPLEYTSNYFAVVVNNEFSSRKAWKE